MVWACDFETYPSLLKTWVWAWGASSILDPVHFVHGSDIEGFIDWAVKQKKLYFHNLKFDGAFIMDYLLSHGWKCVKNAKNHMEVSTLISRDGLWYSISLKYKSRKISIYDSLKKLPLKVKNIANSFNLPIQKGEINYSPLRPPGYNHSKEVLSYLRNDCQIVAAAIQIQMLEGLQKMTIGADALADFKLRCGVKKFKYLFPELDSITDKEIRASYKGGWVYCHRPGTYWRSICFDVNSLYPYVMYTKLLPFGLPLYFEAGYRQDDDYPLYVIAFKADFKLKEGMLPTIQLKHSRFHRNTDYVTEHWGIGTDDIITLTNVDYELFLKHYDIYEIDFIGGYKFHGIAGLFNDYIDYWMNVKQNSTGGKRQLAKLMLNSLYGKFGKNPDTTRKEVMYDGEKIYTITGEKESGKTLYIPMATFITAYARAHTISFAQQNYDRFIYADTDSLHLTGSTTPPGLPVHESELGKWKVEYRSCGSRYLQSKRYMVQFYDEPGNLVREVVCAGMPDNVKAQVNWSNFSSGNTFYGKLVPVYVPGGVTLKETAFTID